MPSRQNPLFDCHCRITPDNRPWGDILRNDRASSGNGAFTDRHAGKNDCTRADPRTIFDCKMSESPIFAPNRRSKRRRPFTVNNGKTNRLTARQTMCSWARSRVLPFREPSASRPSGRALYPETGHPLSAPKLRTIRALVPAASSRSACTSQPLKKQAAIFSHPLYFPTSG